MQSSGTLLASSAAVCFDLSHPLSGKSPDKRNEEDMSTSRANSNADNNDRTASCQSNIDVLHDVNIPEPNTAAPTEVESATALAKALLNNTKPHQINAKEEELIANSICNTRRYTQSKGLIAERFFDAILQYGSQSLQKLCTIIPSTDGLIDE